MFGLEGATLGRYHVLYPLGLGGMSEVYLAHDEQLDRDVAIKVVPRSQTEHVERFQREIEALTALKHDHFLPVLDYGEQGLWHYLVMPYLEHGNLRDEHYVYLADFGLAKTIGERSDITRTGYLMGTSEYMAPELTEKPASTSSDIYALGVLLYEMVTSC